MGTRNKFLGDALQIHHLKIWIYGILDVARDILNIHKQRQINIDELKDMF